MDSASTMAIGIPQWDGPGVEAVVVVGRGGRGASVGGRRVQNVTQIGMAVCVRRPTWKPCCRSVRIE